VTCARASCSVCKCSGLGSVSRNRLRDGPSLDDIITCDLRPSAVLLRHYAGLLCKGRALGRRHAVMVTRLALHRPRTKSSVAVPHEAGPAQACDGAHDECLLRHG
jgi:hypothetical protein